MPRCASFLEAQFPLISRFRVVPYELQFSMSFSSVRMQSCSLPVQRRSLPMDRPQSAAAKRSKRSVTPGEIAEERGERTGYCEQGQQTYLHVGPSFQRIVQDSPSARTSQEYRVAQTKVMTHRSDPVSCRAAGSQAARSGRMSQAALAADDCSGHTSRGSSSATGCRRFSSSVSSPAARCERRIPRLRLGRGEGAV